MKRSILLLVLMLLVVVTGCVRLPRESLEVNRYSIDLPEQSWMSDTSYGLTLLVSPFQASPQQRGDRIFYRDDEHAMNFYYYHRWVISPEQMIGELFTQTLLQSGWFKGGVFQGESGVLPTHEIQGRLLTLYADNRRGHDQAVLEIKLTLLRINPQSFHKEVVFQKSYPLEVVRENNHVESYVEAVNRGVNEWLEQVRVDLEKYLGAEAEFFTEMPPSTRPLPEPAGTTKSISAVATHEMGEVHSEVESVAPADSVQQGQ